MKLLFYTLCLILSSSAFALYEVVFNSIGITVAEQYKTVIDYTLQVAIWVFGAASINQMVNVVIWKGLAEKMFEDNVPRLLKDFVSVIIYSIALTGIIAFVFEKSVSGIVATSGVIGIVLGLALRSIISDIFMGLAINIERPYIIGDWIEVHGSQKALNVTGRVTEINWRTTRLVTEEANSVIIPNSIIGTMTVQNFYNPARDARFEIELMIDFHVPSDHVKRILLAAVKSAYHRYAGFSRNREPSVIIDSVHDTGVTYLVRFWITPWKPLLPAQARDRVFRLALMHLNQAGITPAYPKLDMYHTRMPVRNYDTHNIEDRREIVKRVDFLSVLNEDELTRLADHMLYHFFRERDVVIREGDEGTSMFVLIEGVLEVVHFDDRGQELIDQVQPGEIIGEMSLLTGQKRSATVSAVTDAVAYEITSQQLKEILEARPELGKTISEIVARRQKSRERKGKVTQDVMPESPENLLGRMTGFFRRVF